MKTLLEEKKIEETIKKIRSILHSPRIHQDFQDTVSTRLGSISEKIRNLWKEEKVYYEHIPLEPT